MAITLSNLIRLTASLCLATCCLAAGATSKGDAEHQTVATAGTRRLLILDAHGVLLQQSRYIFLSGRHEGVPVGILRTLGLYIALHDHGRKVSVGEEGTDAVVDFTLNGNTTFSPATTEGDAYDRYDYPLARRIGRQVYVSVEVMGAGFSDWLTVQESNRTHTLTLRRR